MHVTVVRIRTRVVSHSENRAEYVVRIRFSDETYCFLYKTCIFQIENALVGKTCAFNAKQFRIFEKTFDNF